MKPREGTGPEALEDEMNRALKSLGLGYRVIWSPDPEAPRRGESLPEERLIIIKDQDPDQAWDTLVHEAVELKLRRVLNPYRRLVNKLIEYIEEETHREKERFIEELVPLLRELDRGRSDA